MSAFALDDGRPLQRWGAGVGIALLLHGALAVVVVKTVLLVNSGGLPVINVDLPPLEATLGAPPGRLQPVATPESATKPAPSERVITNAPTAAPMKGAQEVSPSKTPASGEGSLPAEAPQDTVVPGAPVLSRDAAESNNAEAGAGGGGGVVSHAAPNAGQAVSKPDASLPAGSMFDSPIDTRITVMPNLFAKKPGGGMVGKKKNAVTLLRPSKHAGTLQQHPHTVAVAPGAPPATNAIGAHVQDRVRAALARAANRGEARNAIGVTTTPAIAGTGNPKASDRVVTNAIGLPVRIQPGIAGTNVGESKTGAVESKDSAINRVAINGRNMARPGLGAGVIGGPARNIAGGISGTNFSLRHP